MIRIKLLLLLSLLLVATCSSALTLDPLEGVTILLDPGHGGTDSGAIGPTGLKESNTNLRVARYLKMLLEADGAEVFMTRNDDSYLSLGQRVEKARELAPDLFVSIHHNASLRPRKTNRSEIYYNALDNGLSQIAGQKMIERLESFGFGEESIIVPGGFFVLRNNPAPSVLTEGSYISIPEIEKQLKTGKALTDQAEALRRAIRETFSNGPLKIKFFVSETPVKINTIFFNFIFAANKPVMRVRARLAGSDQKGFGFDLLPSIGNAYRFYNTEPLQSGQYDLQLTFYAKDGTVAPRITVPVSVELPFGPSLIKPVAPFIPSGYKGKFPISVELRDNDGRLNTRVAPIAVFYGETGQVICESERDGTTTVLLELDGTETSPIEVRVVYDSQILAHRFIPVKEPQKRVVLGRIRGQDRGEEGDGVDNVKIKYGITQTSTIEGGYFFLEYPMIYDNMKLELNPPMGYGTSEHWIKTRGEPVFLETIWIDPIAPKLMGKKLGIMAPREFDDPLRELVKDLMSAGAEVSRLNLPENMNKPEYQAVLEINLKDDFNLVLSLKKEAVKQITARHYHRGGKGKKLADRLAAHLADSAAAIKLSVTAGSDYEISHTGATSLVLAFPQETPPGFAELVLKHLFEVLKSEI